jgi:hypothetical protein
MRYDSLLAAFGLVAFALAAHASTITYDSQSTFTAATSGNTSYNIPAPSSGTFEQVSSPFSIGPLSFSNGSDPLFLLNDGVYGVGQTYLDAHPTIGVAVSFDGATALAFDLSSFVSESKVITVDANGVFAGTFMTPGGPSPVFFGITSSDPITSLTFTQSNPASVDEIDVLNFEVGSAAPVAITPEPCTIALLSTGLLGMVGAAKRRFLHT